MGSKVKVDKVKVGDEVKTGGMRSFDRVTGKSGTKLTFGDGAVTIDIGNGKVEKKG